MGKQRKMENERERRKERDGEKTGKLANHAT